MDTTFTATTTDPPALSISGAPPRSGLAAINNNNKGNNNGATNSAPPSSENIDFTYSDTEVHLKELAELYRYNEELDFTANRTSFEELMKDNGYSLKWTQAMPGQLSRVVERLVAGLELTERGTRVRAIRALLYLAQGNFADCQTVEEQPRFARANIFTLYEYGIFPLLVQLVHFEVGEALKLSDGPPPPAPISTSSQSGSITSLAPNDANSSLKLLVITIVYLFVLEMGRPVEEKEEEEAQHKQQLRDRFKEELMQPISGELLHLTLLNGLIRGDTLPGDAALPAAVPHQSAEAATRQCQQCQVEDRRRTRRWTGRSGYGQCRRGLCHYQGGRIDSGEFVCWTVQFIDIISLYL